MLHVTAVRHVQDHVLWLRFNDGCEGEVDLRNELDGPMFEPLRDVALFGRVSVHLDLQTIVWPNGVDFAPEFLHQQMQALRNA